MQVSKKLLLVGIISALILPSAFEANAWFEKENEPNVKVWQESCNPAVFIKSDMTCQQANFIIKQNEKMIELMEGKK